MYVFVTSPIIVQTGAMNATSGWPPKPVTEPILNALVGGLLNEGRVAPGSIVDAGAFDGTWALWAAARCPERTVFAVDPLESNVVYIMRRAQRNVLALRAALSDTPGTLILDRDARKRAASSGYLTMDSRKVGSHNGSSGSNSKDPFSSLGTPTAEGEVNVRSLDSLFANEWSGHRLALLHLDVEGAEQRVLQGGLDTLLRDTPLLTVEVHVHLAPLRTRALLRLLATHRYECFIVEEICGLRADCRNLLCVHRGNRHRLRGSDTLDLGVASRALLPVDAGSISAHAFPCCARGAACCDHSLRRGCCSHARVHRWLSQHVAAAGADVRWFSRTRWFDGKFYTYRQHSKLHALHMYEMRRALNESGLSYTRTGW